MRPIAAGKLRHVIDIQTKTATTDEWGGTVYTWANFATGVRAKKRSLRGRELIAAQAAQSETTDMWYIRYIPNLNESMRIVHSGKNYDVTYINDIEERNIELEISTKTGMSEG